MHGLMMDQPLLISGLLQHAARHHGDTEIVSKNVDGSLHRYGYRDALVRTKRLANALKRLAAQPADRVATLAYIANHAEDRFVFFDTTFAPLVAKLAPQLKSVKAFVAMADRAHMPKDAIPNLLCYEELIEKESPEFQWPTFDEHTAACLCYTSGTTGNPKGALYSHRSTIIHAYAAALPDTLNLSACDVVLPVVPMFHVNAWSLPYSCAMVGVKLVFPGPHLDGKSLHHLFESERVTLSAGVPTVWLALLNYMKE